MAVCLWLSLCVHHCVVCVCVCIILLYLLVRVFYLCVVLCICVYMHTRLFTFADTGSVHHPDEGGAVFTVGGDAVLGCLEDVAIVLFHL